MGSIITTISLDERTHEIAKSVPNLSEFVRTMLYMHADISSLTHIVQPFSEAKYSVREVDRNNRQTGKTKTYNLCNPFHSKGRCHICWPLGVTLADQIMALKFADGEEE